MKLKLYQVDTFTDQVFKGNPAAVCPLEEWPSDDVLLNISAENNLSETAFYVPHGTGFDIRWFTPNVEVDLCGHATLATAYVLFNYEGYHDNLINFHSHRSGPLTVAKDGEQLLLNFPADKLDPVEITDTLRNTTNRLPLEVFRGKTDYMLVFDKEDDIRSMTPNFPVIAGLDARGIIVTAKGSCCDFVSRFFGPAVGVNEDPVTGSAHTTLTPYWTKKLGKNEMAAQQLSARHGLLYCRMAGERVEIGGKAALYLTGEITI